jgi:prepilin-type N-terminal cleavage/methylation domain-containing protein
MTNGHIVSGACLAQWMGMARNTTRRTGLREAHDGFSLIELMVVAAIAAVLVGISIPVTDSFIRAARADSSVSAATAAIDMAHDRAVSERRNYVLTFTPPNRILLGRQEINAAGVVISTTQVEQFILEGGQTFLKFTGIPDTPDLFGATSATTFSGTAPVMFTSDGSLVDSNGDVVNGSIFFGIPGQPLTQRAVTIFGVTGLTHNWKWRGAQWME